MSPMSGRRFPRSGALGLALAAVVLASSAGCVDRETSDDTSEPGPMHPPELLAARDEACEDYCDTRIRCGFMDEGDSCSCEMATFDNKHQLCVEKSIAKLECLASTSCDFLRPVTYPAVVRVGARVSELGNSSMRMEYAVERTDAPDDLCAKGTSVVVLVRYASLQKVRVPDEMRAAIEALEKHPAS